ncbi:FAD:protein FMN transferase [Tropicimonas sp. S265A]|uniref:FAD:protein FMN transferase n=1 Tax=Tropicimonas sp. S265A TaxID=3415134 RepID=UPI003C7D2A5C
MTDRRLPLLSVVVAVVVLMALVGVARSHRATPEWRETVFVFGTLLEIVIRDADRDRAQRATAATGQMLQTLHNDWHAWQPGALETVNDRLALGQTTVVSPDLASVLSHAKQLSCESGGLFEPGIGQLIALWGFHDDANTQAAPPDAKKIDALREAAPSIADLQIRSASVSSQNPALQLDLGGFGKGAALDMAEKTLAAHGIENAVLNAGGDVNVIGTHGERNWTVAIRDPFVWGAVASIALDPGEVLYTSGNYERYFETAPTRFAHIIDPRTGYPVQNIVSASVLHTNGARADAAATALSVAGQAAWAQVAADMQVASALLITGDGTLLVTPDMAMRLNFETPDLAEQMKVIQLPARRDMRHCRPTPDKTVSDFGH